jgi:hypothetical protein
METQNTRQGLKNKLKTFLGTALIAGTLALNANAQSIFNGIKGPTDFQLDDRVSYTMKEAQNGAKTKTTANNAILKYWDGKDLGTFAFLNVPYKSVDNGVKESEGLGDVFIGAGPRFNLDVGESKLSVLSYLGASLPTGSTNCAPALGTERTDYKAGLLGTLTDKARKYEADFALDYNLTEGKQVSDELSGGFVVGGKVNDNFRLVAGPLFNYKTNGKNGGDYALSGRANIRYTPSGDLGKKMHFELWADRFFSGEGTSAPKENNAVTLVARINFGGK